MPLSDDGTCFACGKSNPDGLQLDIRTTPEGVELDYTPPARYEGWQGIVHGGIVSTLLDELCAWACSARGYRTVTGRLEIRFRHATPIGRPLRGFGRVVRERGAMVEVESRLEDESGNVLAEASARMMKT
ncbi:PaaI family thioesterase [candidate division WOR-3 bacterium]|nr:PaaI family thioesterase [candidate division WOR-3 bacterium]